MALTMWEIENRSPFPHRGGFLRDQKARTFWCLHLKASFALRPGQAPLFCQPQPDLLQGPVYDGDHFLAEAETGHPRPLCDLIISGTAKPPANAHPQRGWRLEARLPGWRKALDVRPARIWQDGRAHITGTPLLPVPLDWRTAYGGEGLDANPAGLGHRPTDGAALPRLVPEGTAPDVPCDTAISFAPIPRDWPQRRQWAGRYDAEWSRRRAPLLPADMDSRYWQATAPDQWLVPDTLPGAALQLSGFGPQPQTITVPECTFEIATRFRGRWNQQEPRLQSVTVDIDAQRLSLLWLAVLPIEAAQNDVLVERSFIALRNSRGFAVSGADMPLFNSPWEAA